MNKHQTIKVETIEDQFIRLPEGWAEEGEKLSLSFSEEGFLIISKMSDLEIDLTDDEFIKIARMAHEKDTTFNEIVSEILQDYINKNKNTFNDVEDEEESASQSIHINSLAIEDLCTVFATEFVKILKNEIGCPKGRNPFLKLPYARRKKLVETVVNNLLEGS